MLPILPEPVPIARHPPGRARVLPDERDAVGNERFVLGDDRQAIGLRLGYEQAIERVAVMPGEGLDRRGVVER